MRVTPPGSSLLPVAVAILAAVMLAAACGSPAGPTPAMRAEYRALPADGRAPTPEDLQAIRDVVLLRLADTGLASIRVALQGDDAIVVETSATGEAADVVRVLAGTTGRLDIVPVGRAAVEAGQAIDLAAFPPLVSGDQVADATIGSGEAGARVIDLALDQAGTERLAEYTAAHVGDRLAIVLDGQAISLPVIQEPITDGRLRVVPGQAGGLSLEAAQRLVSIIRSGALPFPLQEVAFSGG